jgi:hypothetical protein
MLLQTRNKTRKKCNLLASYKSAVCKETLARQLVANDNKIVTEIITIICELTL